jgi:O-antigen ligase
VRGETVTHSQNQSVSGAEFPNAGWHAAYSIRLRPRLSWLVSFEMLFAIMLVPGFRTTPSGKFSLPLSLWIGVGALCVYGLVELARSSNVPARAVSVVSIGFLFTAYATFTLFFSPSVIWGTQKAILLWVLDFTSLAFAALVVGRSRDRVVRLVVLIAAIGCAFAGILLPTALSSSNPPPSLFGAEYLLLSHWMGYGALGALAYTLLVGRGLARRAGGTIVFTVVVLVMLTTGGRGPLLGLAGSTLVLLLGLAPSLARRKSKASANFVRWSALIVVTLLFVTQLVGSRPLVTIERLDVLLTPTRGASAQARIVLAEDSIRLWETRPEFGVGLGGFPVLAGLGDRREYPHDLVLELLVETGLVGLLLFGMVLVTAIRSLGRLHTLRRDPLRMALLALFVYSFTNALFSGDLVDNRGLLAFAGLCLVGIAGRSQAESPVSAHPATTAIRYRVNTSPS